MSEGNKRDGPLVRHFRQILLWPLQLMPIREDAQIQQHWDLLERTDPSNPWREVADEFTGDPAAFQERHYSEFVAFLPYVQRFLYGEGKGRGSIVGESPIRVFRRDDVTRVRLTYPDSGALVFEVAHVDLYFFYDLDVTILAVEIFGEELSLARVQETLFRFGRAYPSYWEPDGSGGACLRRVEWLSATGDVLAVSDFERREKYLSFVCRYRAPCIASHWEFLLKPLVLHHSDEKGPIRYRQVEFYRMPVMGYLALDDPRRLTRADFMRLALVTAPGESGRLPFSARYARDFEQRYCCDRYWDEEGAENEPGTRYLTSGYAFMMVGSAKQRLFVDAEAGLLAQFRHQYFLLFLIPHLHKAALLMMSDRLVESLNRLDIRDPESVRRFKRAVRQMKEIFLRFAHRYWVYEVSDQAQAKELYRMNRGYLDCERLYAEVHDEIEDMSGYLDSDSLRRQAGTVVRLTVVTIFGLIGTVTTGFLGMNLIAAAENPLWLRMLFFALVLIPTIGLTLYSIVKSKRLSDFLEVLSDERLPARTKLAAFAQVWRKKRKPSA